MDKDKETHHSQANRQNHNEQGFSFDDQQAGFVMGAVVGAVVGGAAALLLSPKNGKEMRDIVKKYSKDLESEAYDLAKESRGVAKSFKSVLEDGATDVMEHAPEKIEQASYQAQQLAGDLNERFESARDVVAELAEAFRSGWEEYGEDRAEDEGFEVATPILFDVDEAIEDKNEDKDKEVKLSSPVHGRRRTHASASYSMHAAKESTEEKPAVNQTDADEATSEISEKPDKKDTKEKASKSEAPSRAYTTRVVEEPRKVSTAKSKSKAADGDSDKKAPAKPKKKLLFRRGG